MKVLEFRGGDAMPIMGLGTWKSGPGQVKEAIVTAVNIGYRHIDCAPAYGNEAEVGESIRDCLRDGAVGREELWITSKLWNDSHQREYVRTALEKTLKDLQLQYLDLYLIHWPVALKHGTGMPRNAGDFIPLEKVPVIETWRAMEELKKAGLVKHIGLSNFSRKKIEALLPMTEIKPEVNQIELHPYLQQSDLVEFCQSHHIHVTGYSPLGSKDRPEGMKKENEPIPLENEVIRKLAQKHHCTEAQILLAWEMARNVAVIPKSVHADRIRENFDAVHVAISQEDRDEIAKLDKGYRFLDGSEFDIDGSEYNQESIFDESAMPGKLAT